MHFKTIMLKNDYVSFFCRFISSVWWDMFSCRNSPYDNVYYFIYHIHDEKKRLQFNIFRTEKKENFEKNYEFVCCWEYLWPKRKYTPCLVFHDSYKKANITYISATTEFARNIAFKHVMRSWTRLIHPCNLLSDLDFDSSCVHVVLSRQQRRDQQCAVVPRQRHLKLVQQIDDVAASVHGAQVRRLEHVLQVI